MRLTQHLPGIALSTSYGRPALKVRGKLVANLCSVPGALAVHCPIETKAMLIEALPDFYFETPHYRGWPALLVRMEAIDDVTLAERLEAAWMLRAPARLRQQATAAEG